MTRYRSKAVEIFRKQAILVVLLLLAIVMSIISNKFLSLTNIFNIIKQVSILGIMACGMTVVVIGGGIDLSVGSILSLSIVVATKTQSYGYFASVVMGLLTGTLCGLVNGFLIGKVRANPILVTLANLTLFQAATYIYVGGMNVPGKTGGIYAFLGRGSILGIPTIIVALLIVLLITGILLGKTTFGRQLYATGLNPKAAQASGIRISNIKMLTYIILGLTTAFAALILTSRLGRAHPTVGAPYLFDVITAVVLGGTSLSGGVGSIYRTAIGFLFIGVLNNSMVLLGIPSTYQQMIKGMVLILAVLYDEYNKRRRIVY
jgi:ribose/xylose/arabinose/galactoside ABC-type transport system permease subunit